MKIPVTSNPDAKTLNSSTSTSHSNDELINPSVTNNLCVKLKGRLYQYVKCFVYEINSSLFVIF